MFGSFNDVNMLMLGHLICKANQSSPIGFLRGKQSPCERAKMSNAKIQIEVGNEHIIH